MCDVTSLFKAAIKNVKIREKLSSGLQIDKSILPKFRKKSEFAQNAEQVVSHITKLKEFLMEFRKDYLNECSIFGLEQSSMSDLDRDRIDTETDICAKKCKEAINQLRMIAESHKVLKQVRDHREGVIRIVEHYLSAVCRVYNEQKMIRAKRIIEKKKMSKLQSEPILNVVESNSNGSTAVANDKRQQQQANDTRRNKPNKAVQEAEPGDHKSEDKLKDESPPSEETKMLQLENEQIFNDMSTMVDEIKQLEGKIVEISRLQNIFTEKVLEQEKDIDKVADNVVMTTENIKEANEVIREAMKNNAGLRVWILFFLIVCTLSLLFLDWYNV